MGIFDRLGSIISSNVNAMLDKAEDPGKMVDQTLRELREDLADVKHETAGVMAREKECKQKLDECNSKIAKMGTAAKNALKSGDESAARTLLEQKNTLMQSRGTLESAYNMAHQNTVQIRKAHDKLVSDINNMENRKEAIKATASVAKAQSSINKATKGANSTSSIEAFDRMEAKANNMLNRAQAEAELNESLEESNADVLLDKYSGGATSDVDDELARMKTELGM